MPSLLSWPLGPRAGALGRKNSEIRVRVESRGPCYFVLLLEGCRAPAPPGWALGDGEAVGWLMKRTRHQERQVADATCHLQVRIGKQPLNSVWWHLELIKLNCGGCRCHGNVGLRQSQRQSMVLFTPRGTISGWNGQPGSSVIVVQWGISARPSC